MEGRKVPPHMENPIDNVFIYLSEIMNPVYRKLNFTPNILTTFSLIFGILASLALYEGFYVISGICLLIMYYFDCADGNFARTYKMYSDFGDKYDHYSDLVKNLLMVIALYFSPMKKSNKITLCVLVVVLQGLSMIHYGCQEKVFNMHAGILDFTKKLCPEQTYIKYTRFIGLGTFIVAISLYIMIQHKF